MTPPPVWRRNFGRRATRPLLYRLRRAAPECAGWILFIGIVGAIAAAMLAKVAP